MRYKLCTFIFFGLIQYIKYRNYTKINVNKGGGGIIPPRVTKIEVNESGGGIIPPLGAEIKVSGGGGGLSLLHALKLR